MFSNIEILHKLIDAKKNHRLAHALLLIGNEGVGKMELAKKFSQYLLCSSLDKNEQACSSCKDCYLFLAQTHGDFYCITTDNNRSIGVDQIREIKQHAYQTRQRGEYKIFIISRADKMTISAANALLKVLEEPPEGCIFILISENQSSLPATILSRCQKYIFFSPTYNKLDEFKDLAFGFEQYFARKISVVELSKMSQEKSIVDVLNIAYVVCHNLLKTKMELNRQYIYKFIDKILEIKKLLASQVALNESLLMEYLLFA